MITITMLYDNYNYTWWGLEKPTNITGGPHIVGNICKYDLNIGLKAIIHATYIGYIYIYIWENYGIWNFSTIDMGNDMGYKYSTIFVTPSLTHHLLHAIFYTPSFTYQLCHPPSFTFHLSCAISDTPSFTHPLSHLTLSHAIFYIPSFTHNFVTHYLWHTTLSHTIFPTPLQTIFHTPSFTHNFVTHHLWHITLSHTIFPRPSQTIFHTPSFTHHFVTHHLSPHHLSHTHTTLSHTIFPPPPPLSFLPSPSPLQHFWLIIGRSWLVGLSGPFIVKYNFPIISQNIQTKKLKNIWARLFFWQLVFNWSNVHAWQSK